MVNQREADACREAIVQWLRWGNERERIELAEVLTELDRWTETGATRRIADGGDATSLPDATEMKHWERLGWAVEAVVDEIAPAPDREMIRGHLARWVDGLTDAFIEMDAGTDARSSVLWWLWRVVRFDMEAGSGRVYETVSQVLDDSTTEPERFALEDWLRDYLSTLDTTRSGRPRVEIRRRDAGFLLMRLLWDDLTSEQRLSLADETGQTFPKMTALLELGRMEEAADHAETLDAQYIADVVLLFGEHDALSAVESLIPTPDEGDLSPESACNLAGTFLELGEPERARPWAIQAIRRRPTLDFLDFWQRHSDRQKGWAVIASDVLAALESVDPLTRLEFHLLVGDALSAAEVWQRVDTGDDADEQRVRESKVRRLANMAKRNEAWLLAVELGVAAAHRRLEAGGPEDIEQACQDFVECRDLLRRTGNTDRWRKMRRSLERRANDDPEVAETLREVEELAADIDLD